MKLSHQPFKLGETIYCGHCGAAFDLFGHSSLRSHIEALAARHFRCAVAELSQLPDVQEQEFV